MASFTRKGAPKPSYIPGTRPSIKGNKLLVSTGIPSLDFVLGGGLAVGTCLLIEEDIYGVYSSLFLKYFLAEGVVNGHPIFLSSLDANPSQFILELPSQVIDTPVQPTNTADDELKIAWRYKNLTGDTVPESSNIKGYGNTFTFSKKMEQADVEKADVFKFEASPTENSSLRTIFCNAPLYADLLDAIRSRINSLPTTPPTILRIGLHSLGSPLWNGTSGNQPEQNHWRDLVKFLVFLRMTLRKSNSVCVLTVPTHLFEESNCIWELQQLGDAVIRLESFAAAEKHPNPAFSDYDGVLNLIRLPSVNTLVNHQPDTMQYGFKTKRKRLTVEKLHLPPDLSETASREIGKTTPSCSAATTRNIDF